MRRRRSKNEQGIAQVQYKHTLEHPLSEGGDSNDRATMSTESPGYTENDIFDYRTYLIFILEPTNQIRIIDEATDNI